MAPLFESISELASHRPGTLTLEWRFLRSFFVDNNSYFNDIRLLIRELRRLDYLKTVALWFQGDEAQGRLFLRQGYSRVLKDHSNLEFRVDCFVDPSLAQPRHKSLHVVQPSSLDIFPRIIHESICPWIVSKMNYGEEEDIWDDIRVQYTFPYLVV